VAAVVAGVLTATPPAWADTQPAPGSLTLVQGLGLFVGIPLAVVALVYASVYGLSGRGGRSRSAAALAATPVWFNGPADDARAAGELPAADTPPSPHGGASARW